MEQFLEVLNHPKTSAPGPDGLPYHALHVAAGLCAPLLHSLACELSQNFRDSIPEFNDANMVFIPKGDMAEDTPTSVSRAPSRTRPTTLSKTESKIISSAVNRSLSNFLMSHTVGNQRGFVRGRKILDKVVEVEAQALV